ncbi:MAG TPA: HAMP domain-containing sensor histidine kinase, partial [Minicystis sp.]|nr:HAMP domain-containing sensor histidine kinase [Minicystis sp.]
AALAFGADPSAPGPMRDEMEALARADRVLGLAGFDMSGRTLVVTRDVALASHQLAAVARDALRRGTDIVEPLTLESGETLVRTVTVKPGGGGAPYAIVIVLDVRHIAELSRSLDRGLVVTGFFVLAAIALLVGWASRRMVGGPVGELVQGAERVASGDLDVRVPNEGARELVRLAGAFNFMAERLEEARAAAEDEAQRRAAVETRLRHSQSLAAAGQIAASVAHEIGSPLNVILGRARRGAQHATCPEPVRRELDAIAQQSERITRVVSGLLTLARPARPGERHADLGEVVDDVTAFVAPEARQRGVALRVEQNAEHVEVAIDPDPLFQVVFNLVLNGIQAQHGGELVVRVSGAGADGRATLEVDDKGPGVRAEDAARIFDAFYTTKADEGGSGLGLAIVSGILREAGGAIELVARDGPGALFRVHLPLRQTLHPSPPREMRDG